MLYIRSMLSEPELVIAESKLDHLYFYKKKVRKVQGDLWKYHDYSPYLKRILNIEVLSEVDEQTLGFIYIQPFILPEDEVTEDFKLFFVSQGFLRPFMCL